MTPRDEPISSVMIDRLVDGELDPEARRSLLNRLEAEPDGWRRCALAFLEDREWRSALAIHAVAPPRFVRKPAPRSKAWPWIARAATVLAAFGLGWAIRPSPLPSPVSVSPPVAIGPASRPSDAPASVAESVAHAPAPGYVQGYLEREGYRVEQRQFYVPAATPDGQQVVVPVEEVKVRFVGNRAV